METLPDRFSTAVELEEFLSRPSARLVQFIKELPGDIMILGAGGKVGPTMALLAKRAIEAAGVEKQVIAVDVMELDGLAQAGVKTIKCDLLDLEAVQKLPQVENVIYMVGRKFGSTGSEWLTWAINVIVPYHVARTFVDSHIAVFSTGCVYPVMDIKTGGATEETPVEPVGEYSMSCLGRERMFDYGAEARGAKVVHIRLNYAVDLRYGVLYDVASKVFNGEPVDITTGYANVIWQGDACRQAIQSLALADNPAKIINVTGPETFSIRQVAQQFGRLLGKEPIFTGLENGLGYLSNASQANKQFGNPSVPLGRIIEWTAHWVKSGGENLGKPTHFETQDGKY